MKKIITLSFVPALLVACCMNLNPNSRNANIITTEPATIDYSFITLDASADVYYECKPGIAPYIKIVADESVMPYLSVKVVDGRELKVALNKNVHYSQFDIYTNSTALTGVNVKGSGNLTVTGRFEPKMVDVFVAGSGNFTACDLHCDQANLQLNGSGDITIKGTSRTARMEVRGSGDIDAYGFIVQESQCYIRGSGDIGTCATKSFYGNVLGSGDISYCGNPSQVTLTILGSGDITHK